MVGVDPRPIPEHKEAPVSATSEAIKNKGLTCEECGAGYDIQKPSRAGWAARRWCPGCRERCRMRAKAAEKRAARNGAPARKAAPPKPKAPPPEAAAALPELNTNNLDQVLERNEIPGELPEEAEDRDWWLRLGYLARLAEWERVNRGAADAGMQRAIDQVLRETPAIALIWARQRLVWLLDGRPPLQEKQAPGDPESQKGRGPSEAPEDQASEVDLEKAAAAKAGHPGAEAQEDKAPQPDSAAEVRQELIEEAEAGETWTEGEGAPAQLNGAASPAPARAETHGHDVVGLDIALRARKVIDSSDALLSPRPASDLYPRLLELHNLILRAELGRGSLAEAEKRCAALVEEVRP